LGGAVVIERFFDQPGLGTLMLEAYASRDVPVLEASIAAAGSLFVVVQVLTTGMTLLVDPRARKVG
jgi:peptide/nickel transport system permease protein